MPDDSLPLVDGSSEQPANATPDTATNPEQVQGANDATPATAAGEAAQDAATPDSGAVQNGSSNGDMPKAEPPQLTDSEADKAAWYMTVGSWPKGYTPSKNVRAWVEWKKGRSAGVPEGKKGSGDGEPSSGATAPVPVAEKKVEDAATKLRAAYATIPADKVQGVMEADWYLEHHGVSRETLVDMKPDARVHLAVTLKKRDGNVARLAGQASPRQKPPERPADAAKQPPANKADPNPQVNDEVMSDAPQEVRDALSVLDDAEAKAVVDFIKNKTKQPEAEPEVPDWSPAEQRLIQGNVQLLEREAVAEFPWIGQQGAKDMVTARVKAFAESVGVWPEVLTDFDRLKAIYFDQAYLVQARDVKGSKTVAAQAAAVTATAVRPPQGRSATGPRELSQSEIDRVSARAARDSRGNRQENSRLFQKYMAEARGS